MKNLTESKSLNRQQARLHIGLIENEIMFFQDNITLAKKAGADVMYLNGLNKKLFTAKQHKQSWLNVLLDCN